MAVPLLHLRPQTSLPLPCVTMIKASMPLLALRICCKETIRPGTRPRDLLTVYTLIRVIAMRNDTTTLWPRCAPQPEPHFPQLKGGAGVRKSRFDILNRLSGGRVRHGRETRRFGTADPRYFSLAQHQTAGLAMEGRWGATTSTQFPTLRPRVRKSVWWAVSGSIVDGLSCFWNGWKIWKA